MEIKPGIRATKGYGILENFLARKRACMADRLIPFHLRVGRILDIGCGSYPYFLEHVEFNEKYGIDPSIKQVSKDKKILFETFNIEELERFPFDDGYIDVVTMLAVIEHLQPSQLPTVLKEIRRILTPGGCLIITTPCPWSRILLLLLAGSGFVSREELDDHKTAYGREVLTDYFLGAGFDRENIQCGYFEMFLNGWFRVER